MAVSERYGLLLSMRQTGKPTVRVRGETFVVRNLNMITSGSTCKRRTIRSYDIFCQEWFAAQGLNLKLPYYVHVMNSGFPFSCSNLTSVP